MERLAGCVLAGGRSTRMGRDKALLRINGRTLHALALDKLAVCTTLLYTSGERVDPEERRSIVLKDPYSCGPVGGIVTALEASEAEWMLFLPVDMPLVPEAWMRNLAQMTVTSNAIAIVTRTPEGPQPLVAAYRRSVLPELRCAVEVGQYKVMAALVSPVQWIEAGEEFSGQFRNLNTPEELSDLRRLGFDISWEAER
ncbi:molybdenum cofactor guanylyltransferase [Terriglobus albidus]|uniref:Probable molybdenum cofactor guanylyltransferase n=1 Tax=Terriglobus albidus TaxID=1592106 RepID=A0A5B9EGC5_9BACT|nr:molybdenum cofactor guanylyltransferase [Terriglobus albidus]QEE29491.1 molybdenum cofactor guanylyltransferase [Terriglobus albidus]